jgi:hypothetical protein
VDARGFPAAVMELFGENTEQKHLRPEKLGPQVTKDDSLPSESRDAGVITCVSIVFFLY